MQVAYVVGVGGTHLIAEEMLNIYYGNAKSRLKRAWDLGRSNEPYVTKTSKIFGFQ